MDIYSEILRIEREIHEIQIQHSLNKISTKSAKQKIRILTEELHNAIVKLPPMQRDMYLLEKQQGLAS